MMLLLVLNYGNSIIECSSCCCCVCVVFHAGRCLLMMIVVFTIQINVGVVVVLICGTNDLEAVRKVSIVVGCLV